MSTFTRDEWKRIMWVRGVVLGALSFLFIRILPLAGVVAIWVYFNDTPLETQAAYLSLYDLVGLVALLSATLGVMTVGKR